MTPLDVSVQFARDGQTDTSLQLGSLPHRNTSAGEELPRLQHTTEFSLREQEVSAGTREAGGDAARVRVKKTKNKAKQKNKKNRKLVISGNSAKKDRLRVEEKAE